MTGDDEILREAIRDLHKGETLERTVGRIVRRHSGTYEDYVRIMDSVRDLAARDRLTPIQAARTLAHA